MPVTGLGAVTVAATDPLPDSTTERPPLAVESAAILAAAGIASTSSVATGVAENAGTTGPDASVPPHRTSALTKREVRFMMTSAIRSDRDATVRHRPAPAPSVASLRRHTKAPIAHRVQQPTPVWGFDAPNMSAL